MNRSHKIRLYLSTQNGPRTLSQIAEGIALPGDLSIKDSLQSMVRGSPGAGPILTKDTTVTPPTYALVRMPSDAATLTPEEAKQRRRERDAARHRVRVPRSREQWLAEVRSKKVAPYGNATPKPARAQPNVARKPDPAPRCDRAPETVEQWMARTGQEPEVLKPGIWSTPLRIEVFA